MLEERLVDRLVELVVEQLPDVTAIYLFGSQSTSRARGDSDVDIAVLRAEPLMPVHRWELQERIAAELGRDVDLVDLASASTVMRAQVVATGKRIHESDAGSRSAFEGAVLADYARLNEERREILDRIQAEGRIHG